MARGLKYLLFLLAVLVVVDAALYWRCRRVSWQPPPKRPFIRPIRHVPTPTLLRLGWIEAGKDSSFVHFDRAKRPGVVRVGCVGDSFTYGAEVGRSEDYPTILQRLFRERGCPQVEVVNFGSGWYGFQQAFILWNDVARGFDLDYVLLGPKTFFPGRDTTFDHGSPATIYFLHARHVLEGEGLRLLEVIGETFESRTAAYRRFIPHWRYLRYDRRPAAFLACLVPRGRELTNPFYYHRDSLKEARELYRRLLRRMADSGAQVVLGHYEPDIVEVGRSVSRGSLYSVKLEEVHRFPYRAVKNHNSPAGNRLLAEQFFALLTGRAGLTQPLIRWQPLPPSAPAPAGGAPRGLDSFHRATVDLDGGKPWRFVEIQQGMAVRDLPPGFLRAFHARSLLALRLPQQPLPEAAFLPLPVELKDGMPLVLRSRRGTTVLGRVSLMRPDLQVGSVDISAEFDIAYPAFNDSDAVFFARGPVRRFLPGTLYLGEQAIAQVARPDRAGHAGFHPTRRRFLRIYPPSEILGAKTAPGRGGFLTLRFESDGGKPTVVPLAAWSRTDKDLRVSFDAPPIPHPIRKGGR